MITARDFGKAFLWQANQKGISIDNLKLQKLVYYCQGYHLSLYGVPAFKGKIKAWRLGPVSPSLYNEYKCYESNPIAYESFFDGKKILELFPKTIETVINLVLKLSGTKSSNQLINMTHSEAPWLSHSRRGKGDNKEITHCEMKAFFDNKVSEIQGDMLAEILDAVSNANKSGNLVVPQKAYESDDEMLAWIKKL